MIDSDDEGDFTESSIFDLDSAPPPPDGHHSPRSRRWKQPGNSLTNALPVRKRAFSAPSVSLVRSSTMPSSRQVAFAASRDSEEQMGMHGSNDDTVVRGHDEHEDDDDDQNSSKVGNEEQHDISQSLPDDVTPNSRTSAEIMEDELLSCDAGARSPTPRLSSHDVSSSRWSDSEFHSTGESGDNDTPSPTRSLPWGNELPDCCSSEIISWNRTSYLRYLFLPDRLC
jgi:hypothetical protein